MNTYHKNRGRRMNAAFTLIELIVVMAVIAILAGAVLVAGRSLVDSGRSKNTQMMLSIVRSAVEEFSNEQESRSSITRKRAYRNRYGTYPPDELELFTAEGIPNGPSGSLAPGGKVDGGQIVRPEVVPGPASSVPFDTMTGQVNKFDTEDKRAIGNRDMAAMLLTIDLYSEAAKVMIDKLSADHLVTPVRTDGKPLLFLDRNANQQFDPLEDHELRYLVDDWGTPIQYFAQRDFDQNAPTGNTDSSNHEKWNEAATQFVKLNGLQPVIMSYGPNGAEQLELDIILAGQNFGGGAPPATIIDDFVENGVIDSPLNDDNIYPDESIKDILRRGAR